MWLTYSPTIKTESTPCEHLLKNVLKRTINTTRHLQITKYNTGVGIETGPYHIPPSYTRKAVVVVEEGVWSSRDGVGIYIDGCIIDGSTYFHIKYLTCTRKMRSDLAWSD